MSVTVEYHSHNSGGDWWLTDDDWRNLEAAGWNVAWMKDVLAEQWPRADENGRWLGALATSATKEVADPQEAIDEWQSVTGQDPAAEGCNCCGSPHSFEYRDTEGKTHYTSVTVTETRPSWK